MPARTSGAGMRGGSLVVRGNAGAFAATGMQGGQDPHLREHGGFPRRGASPATTRGCRGGLVLVDGNTGDRLGDRMRRGHGADRRERGRLLRLPDGGWDHRGLGQVGSSPAWACGGAHSCCGQTPGPLPPTFNDCGEYPLNFLTLLVRSWRTLQSKFATLPDSRLPRAALHGRPRQRRPRRDSGPDLGAPRQTCRRHDVPLALPTAYLLAPAAGATPGRHRPWRAANGDTPTTDGIPAGTGNMTSLKMNERARDIADVMAEESDGPPGRQSPSCREARGSSTRG